MNLVGDDLHAAYHCAAEILRRRRLTGQPIPQWLHSHYRRLDAAVRVSRSGHESTTTTAELEQDKLISAAEAAPILGKSKRQVQRIATDLDGEIVSGRWLFKLKTVEEYAEAMRHE